MTPSHSDKTLLISHIRNMQIFIFFQPFFEEFENIKNDFYKK